MTVMSVKDVSKPGEQASSGEPSVTEAGAEVSDRQKRVMRNHLVFLIFKNSKLLYYI